MGVVVLDSRGGCVCVVGEWCGDTADTTFHASLGADFALVRRVPLPNWTDTAHELTVWQRRPQDRSMQAAAVELLPVACASCGAVASRAEHAGGRKGAGKGSKPLRRCQYCREAAYCSAGCMHADAARHAEVHAMRLVFFAQRQLNYNSPVDFAPLPI
jgi:hypothetical protein